MSEEQKYYQIVEASDSAKSEKAVSDLIAEGWMCQGGVSITRWDYTDRDGYIETFWWYVQAMTKSPMRPLSLGTVW